MPDIANRKLTVYFKIDPLWIPHVCISFNLSDIYVLYLDLTFHILVRLTKVSTICLLLE